MNKKRLFFFILLAVFFLLISPLNFWYSINIKAQQYILSQVPSGNSTQGFLLALINGALPDIKRVETAYYVEQWYKQVHILYQKETNKTVYVNDTPSLMKALAAIEPNSQIQLADGVYKLQKNKIKIVHPVFITAANQHQAIIELYGQEGFWLNAANIQISGLHFIGKCQTDTQCEHAIHMVGNADHTVISNNIFENFNSHIKSNGVEIGEQREFPDNIIIAHNQFINEWQRNTDTPVTPIDAVGGDDWQIHHNFIADFAKLGGNQVAYGAFLKGGGHSGKVHNNLVICEWRLLSKNKADVRVGLSLGGGGTAKKQCVDGACAYEHELGELTENTILNCPNDVGLYLNKAKSTQVSKNLILGSLGVQMRFKPTSAMFTANIIEGDITKEAELTHQLTENTFLAH